MMSRSRHLKCMNRTVTVIAIAGLLSIAAQALAVDTTATGQPPLSRRQMASQIIGCMKKRMAASRSISYYEAAKLCKEQLKQSDGTAGPLVAADAPAKP